MKKIIRNSFSQQLFPIPANPQTRNLDANGQPTAKGKSIVNPRSITRPTK